MIYAAKVHTNGSDFIGRIRTCLPTDGSNVSIVGVNEIRRIRWNARLWSRNLAEYARDLIKRNARNCRERVGGRTKVKRFCLLQVDIIIKYRGISGSQCNQRSIIWYWNFRKSIRAPISFHLLLTALNRSLFFSFLFFQPCCTVSKITTTLKDHLRRLSRSSYLFRKGSPGQRRHGPMLAPLISLFHDHNNIDSLFFF